MVVVLYLAGMLAVGGFFYFRNRSTNDLFAAGGQSPWWVSGLSSFMTVFSAATFVVWGGIAYEYGVVALSINMCYGVAALMAGYLVAGRWKAIGVSSGAEYVALRFGPGAAHFFTWVMMSYRLVGSAVALYGLAVLLTALMPLPAGHPLQDPDTGTLSVRAAILIFGGVVVLYTMVGGLWAVLMTDVVQFLLLTLAVSFVAPLMLMEIGGLEAFALQAPDGFFDLARGDFTWFFLAGWCLVNFFMIGAEWAFAQRYVSVRSPKDARKSAFLFGALYLVSPFLWLSPPLFYRVLDPTANPEQAYILASERVLPVGMMGLMVAAMFSATASMVSSQLNVFAGALTGALANAAKGRGSDGPRLLWIGRGLSGVLGGVLIAIALLIPHIGGAATVVIAVSSLIAGPLLAPALVGLLSRTLSTRSLWTVVGTSLVAGLVLKLLVPWVDGTFGHDWMQGLANWIQSSMRSVDLIIGVWIPVVVLAVALAAKRTHDAGWDRVSALRHRQQASPARGGVDRAPLVVVAAALALIGMSLLGVAYAMPEDRMTVGLFGAVILGVVGVILVMLRLGAYSRGGRSRGGAV